jgi:predicted transcriptional regulator
MRGVARAGGNPRRLQSVIPKVGSKTPSGRFNARGRGTMVRGKTRHQLFLPDEVSKRLTKMAKAQNRALSDLLLEAVQQWLNQRSAPAIDEKIAKRLDRVARTVDEVNRENFIISHSLNRFIRHQLIMNAALPQPDDAARALGEQRFQTFMDALAKRLAKSAENDNQAPDGAKIANG